MEDRRLLAAQVFSPQTVVDGPTVTFEVVYTALDDSDVQDNSIKTTGVSLRMHYRSNEVSPDIVAIEASSFSGATVQDKDDTSSDFDSDPTTDRYVNFLWFDRDGLFPRATTLPLTLFTADFDSVNDFTGLPVVQFSGSPPPGFDLRSTPLTVSNSAALLDVTGNGNANAFQDGILIVRQMLGQPDANLEGPALIPAESTRTTGAAIRAHLQAAGNALDVNGDGNVNAFQDGILIVRFLLGQPDENLQGPALIPAGSTRTTGAAIRAYLQTLLPAASGGEFVASGSHGEGELIAHLRISPANPADVNGDGMVTMRDALNVINAVERGVASDEDAVAELDINRDGRVSAADAVYVINRVPEDAVMPAQEDELSDVVDRLLSDDAFVAGLF